MSPIPRVFLYLLIMIFFIGYLDGRKSMSALLFRKIVTTYGEKYASAFAFDISENQETLNITLNIVKNITVDVWLRASILQKESKTHYKELFTYNINLCQVMDQGKSLSLINYWLKNIFRYTNLPMSCPIREGNYHWINLKSDKETIPGFIKSGSYRIDSSIYMREWHNDLLTNCSMFIDIKMK
ncbi:uncharacterized protein Dwil_GK16766 [Drosophila willistoni]|uniref:MD-2-related lipid-recognition domain-containing protein n=1 Tax=Drosophila willistoni TaxID=7260 RepID=B4MM93_DROWI|nr:uncharacterized protein LOC6639295 [Drosophila willistoni]EDW73238.2 uncharacterized protein Dwil_GK16766 [Drosophila willistoni]